MAHVSMRKAVRDVDPVVVTTSSKMCEEEEGRLTDSQRRKLPLSSLPEPSLSYALPEENHLEG